MSERPSGDRSLRSAQAGSFGQAVAEYERGRPGYPEAALDWLLPAEARVVLDLGAGTGKFTRHLVSRGLEVIAVEPSVGMLEQLTENLPQVRALSGRAEAIPLPDASVEAVLVAQAWHWVEVERAVPEVARVLRPGGRLSLVWNTRDERVDWVTELTGIVAGGVAHIDTADPPIGPPFGRVERRDFEWRHALTPQALLDMVASRSYMITAAPEHRARVLDQVRRLTEEHPALAGRTEFEMPYVTQCSRAELPG